MCDFNMMVQQYIQQGFLFNFSKHFSQIDWFRVLGMWLGYLYLLKWPNLDFYLWEYLKEKVCVIRPSSLENLKVSIYSEIRSITLDFLRKVMNHACG